MVRLGMAGSAVLLALALSSCGGTETLPGRPPPALSAEVVQLRRDQVLERVEVALRNTGRDRVVVERLGVRIPGYDSGPAIPKDSLIPPDQVVNLPWPYGRVRCPEGAPPAVGRAVVTLRIRSESDATGSERVRIVARDPRGLLPAIARRTCTVARLAREVELRFGDTWRAEQGRDGVTIHGTLLARLLIDEPRSVTQVAGAIMYGLKPDESGDPVRDPLASLTPGAPEASIPVRAYAARCDGHTIGEIKKPYEFLVWVGAPGGTPVAVTPVVDASTKQALRQVCAF